MALICFVGDVHGHVFEMLAAVTTWQRVNGRRFDLVVQLGDFGELYESTDPDDYPDDSYERIDPGQFDLTRLVRDGGSGTLGGALEAVASELVRPIAFLAGNHDDRQALASIESHGLFGLAPDGSVLHVEDVRVLCIGCPPDRVIDVGRAGGGSNAPIDVIATHSAPFGLARGYRGFLQGSREVATLVERVEPRWCFGGDLHHVIGPVAFGRTDYHGLAGISSGRWRPAPGVSPGSLAVLDTESRRVGLVYDTWLAEIGGFGRTFDFAAWWRSLRP